MFELPSLYEHQTKIVDDLRAALRRHDHVILCANTGVGKSRMAKWIMSAAANNEPKSNQTGRSLFAVHRRGLVDNIRKRLDESPALPHGVIMAGCETDWAKRIQVASIDTVQSWKIEKDQWTSSVTFDLVVFDECHSHHSKLLTAVTAMDERRKELGLRPAFVVGLSATPRFKGNSFYGEIVTGPPATWLIDNKYLVPFRYMGGTKAALNKLKKRGGDFTTKSKREAFAGLTGDLVRDYLRYAKAEEMPTVGFFTYLSEAREAQQRLRAEGIKCEYIDGQTSDEERSAILTCLDRGDIDYVANVGVIERGTDIPGLKCVQLCTSTASLPRYRQMIGRGSRPAPGKEYCLVLDHGGNVAFHNPYGFFEDDVPWEIENTDKAPIEVAPRPTIECPSCSAIYRGGMCKNCGYEPTKKERAQQGLDFDRGELVPLKKDETKPKVKTNHDIMVAALFQAGRSGRTWKQAYGLAREMAEDQGTKFRCPRTVTVAGQEFRMVPYGDSNSTRRVKAIFPWTVGDWQTPCWNEQQPVTT